MGELKKINVHIAGKAFPVKVTPAEEEMVKNIEKELNHKINEYQMNFSGQDKSDYLSMTLLTYAFELEKAKKIEGQNGVMKRLSDLETSIDKVL